MSCLAVFTFVCRCLPLWTWLRAGSAFYSGACKGPFPSSIPSPALRSGHTRSRSRPLSAASSSPPDPSRLWTRAAPSTSACLTRESILGACACRSLASPHAWYDPPRSRPTTLPGSYRIRSPHAHCFTLAASQVADLEIFAAIGEGFVEIFRTHRVSNDIPKLKRGSAVSIEGATQVAILSDQWVAVLADQLLFVSTRNSKIIETEVRSIARVRSYHSTRSDIRSDDIFPDLTRPFDQIRYQIRYQIRRHLP